MMSFSDFIYEIGNQVCITEGGTTGLTESNPVLRKFSDTQVKSYVGSSFRKLENLSRNIERKRGDDKIELLSQQINELGKILGILCSREIRD